MSLEETRARLLDAVDYVRANRANKGAAPVYEQASRRYGVTVSALKSACGRAGLLNESWKKKASS